MLRPTLYRTYQDKDLLYVYKGTSRNTQDFNEIIDEIETSRCESFGIFIDDETPISTDDIIALVDAAGEKTGLVLKYMNAGYEEVLMQILSTTKHTMLHIDSTLYSIIASNIMTRQCLPEYLHIGIRDVVGAREIANAVRCRGIESIAITTTDASYYICEFMRHCGAIKSLNIIFTTTDNQWSVREIYEIIDTASVNAIVGASLETFGFGVDGIMLTTHENEASSVFRRILACGSIRKFNVGGQIPGRTMAGIISAIIDAKHLRAVTFDSPVYDSDILRLITETNLCSIIFYEFDALHNEEKNDVAIDNAINASKTLLLCNR